MLITFKNCSMQDNMVITVNDQVHFISHGELSEYFCQSEKAIFEVKTTAFDEIDTLVSELDEEIEDYSFKDRIIAKLTKRFAKKITDAALDITIKYEISCKSGDHMVVNLYDGMYTVCDGKIASAFDIMPIGYLFSRAEIDSGEIKVLDANSSNHKNFLKLMRNILLFMHWGLFFLDLFFFIPEYSIIKYYSSHIYIKQLFIGLYNKSAHERSDILAQKEQSNEAKEKKKGCISSFFKLLLVILVIGGICFWAMTSEPDVIISEDFSSVICFDETFVRIDDGLPEDAENVFLEDYSAYYPTDNEGGYDMENYYCYIYETPDGTRYMWLKDNCNKEENIDKNYEDYQNPLVYKSVG